MSPGAYRQSASTVLMIRPVRFGSNLETLATNAFQSQEILPEEEIQARALAEFTAFVRILEEAHIKVLVFDDTSEPHTPDSIFPNNWVTFHADGTVVLYPMLAPSRRAEIRRDIIEKLNADLGYRVGPLVDLTDLEASGHYLEGTGSLVLDRLNRIVYACLSPRTSPVALERFAGALGYRPVVFHAHDRSGVAVYHTNVVMTLGDVFALVCLEAIQDREERELVRESLAGTRDEVVELSMQQMHSFAGNMLQLSGKEELLVASTRAHAALDASQIERLERHVRFLVTPLPTIEAYGGGSARCMLAEVYLPSEE